MHCKEVIAIDQVIKAQCENRIDICSNKSSFKVTPVRSLSQYDHGIQNQYAAPAVPAPVSDLPPMGESMFQRWSQDSLESTYHDPEIQNTKQFSVRIEKIEWHDNRDKIAKMNGDVIIFAECT